MNATWQNGTGPAPKGYVIRCTGCSRCEVEGHLPMRRMTPEEYRTYALAHNVPVYTAVQFNRQQAVTALDFHAGEE